ncbi:toxin ParE1/3/4 [Neorhizobium sp. 2083]|uniref:type II toxin-antitoxin system RelE/ParE family toxin n=1 Tax=Neorhizobium sp. 2083 TaxID=2817762 RepID=UPI002858CF73|nr:type II toxin-antitoxin system RelE/ParE family toxin [Neorhizobium sp. 2083]MDR6819478.1 toxin ParE1/3/4 [Neorhizobium sp. 2083]
MVREVLFHPLADADLEAIYHFIANDSPERAIAFVRRIRAFSATLATMSERGRRRDDLAEGVRTIVFERRVIVAYRLADGSIIILRIFYGGQNIDGAEWPSG